jgi:hypothetical protein
MTDLADLQLLAALPAIGEQGMVINDWEKTEQALGVAFPSAFPRFLDVFGGVKFDDFLRVYRAGAENVDLVARTLTSRETMETTRPHIRELLSQRGVTPPQLIRWGGTDNADMCFLIPTRPTVSGLYSRSSAADASTTSSKVPWRAACSRSCDETS